MCISLLKVLVCGLNDGRIRPQMFFFNVNTECSWIQGTREPLSTCYFSQAFVVFLGVSDSKHSVGKSDRELLNSTTSSDSVSQEAPRFHLTVTI